MPLRRYATTLLQCVELGGMPTGGTHLAQPSCHESWDKVATIKHYSESEPCYYEGGQAVVEAALARVPSLTTQR